MFKYLRVVPIVLLATALEAQPDRIERVGGDGFVRASAGNTVEFAVNIQQRDPADPSGLLVAVFYSFPQHLFMTFESTVIESVAVDRRTALVTGTATVHDTRSDFEGEIEFEAVFEDQQSESDQMTITLHLPTGAESFSGGLLPGDIRVGRRRQ